MRALSRTIAAAVVVLAALCPSGARAQASDSAQAGSSGPFFIRKDAFLAAGFAAGAVGLSFADESLARTLQDPSLQESDAVRRGASFFRFMGEPGSEIAALGLYAGGRFLLHERGVAAIGLHGAESIVLSAAITGVVKLAAGRARPYVSTDADPFDFDLGRGFRGHDYVSFPSGHASTAFAVASSISAEMDRVVDRKGWWPGWRWVIGGAMYGGAGMVGLSRMYHDQHWASDVVAGAAIGTFSGIKVVKYAYRHPNNRVDRWLLATTVLPDGNGGLTLAWSLADR